MNTNKEDKFQWIEDIIYTNVLGKVKGKLFSNILDLSQRKDTLILKISSIFKDSRLYLYLKNNSGNSDTSNSKSYKIINIREELKQHSYDLILSVFDLHTLNEIQISEQINMMKEISNHETIFLLSDISTNNLKSSFLLKLASFFNSRLNTIISSYEMTKILEEKGLVIIDKDEYKINNIWSGWVITAKKA